MRKTFLTITAVGLLLGACTSTQDEELMIMTVATSMQSAVNENAVPGHRSPEEAIALAAKYLASTEIGVADVTPIMASASTDASVVAAHRSALRLDTLAYVINAPDSAGFVLIAYDTAVPPLLAYSESGSFATEGEHYDIIYDMFLSRIPEYLERRDSLLLPSITLPEYTVIPPLMSGPSWGQYSPYDKYVIQEHPGCPVGCAAVAGVWMMVYGKDFLVYNNELFNLSEIRDAMATYKELRTKKYWTYDSDSDEYHQWLWAAANYESAQDRIAKLLYYFGPDIKMKYSTNGSGINNSFSVINALSKLGYMTIGTRLQEFSNKLAFEHVKKDYMLYVSGVDEISGIGHAWIIDGAQYVPLYQRHEDVYEVEVIETMIALRCNWGWSGLYDGYYSGDILEVGLPEDAPYHYIYSKKLQFFAFKR